jgi:hypothetical protein
MAFKDIRKSRKWLSANEIGIILLLLILLSALLVGNLYAARILPGGEWLYVRWNAVRTFLSQYLEASQGVKYGRLMPDGAPVLLVTDVNPYGGAIARQVQQLVYGRNAFASEYRFILNDPFYIVLLYTPVVLFPDLVNWLAPVAQAGFGVARAIWMFLSEIALIFTVILAFRLAEWEPPRGLYILLISFGLLNFFSVNALITASPSIFLSILYVGVLLALRAFSDELAGALLFLVAYQWEVSALFFLFILIFVVANRRWNVLLGFGMSLIIVLFVSYLVNPGWGLPYFRAVLSNLAQGSNQNLRHILSNWFPGLRVPIATTVSILAMALLLVEGFASVNAPFRRVVWTAALALSATPLLGLAMFPSNYVVLVLPFVLILALVWERWTRWRALRIASVFLAALAVPFALYLKTVQVYAPFYTDLLTVLPPIAAVLGLYWMRWWVLHSPRTWADQRGFRR